MNSIRPSDRTFEYIDAMTALLSLTCLGPVKVNSTSSPSAKLNSEKQTALLFYLAMKAGHKLRREYLAELLWPDLPIEAARSNLRHAFFHLRQVLNDDANAPPFLLSGREWLSFNPDSAYRLDAQSLANTSTECLASPLSTSCSPCIARMEEMAELYRGEFMADLALHNCEEFNDWLQAERETIRRRMLALLERLSNCHELNSNHGKALSSAQRYLELEPWNEEGHRRVMRIYALSDQASAALSQYESCCRTLKMELGVLPTSETQQLAESIRKGQLRPVPPAPLRNHLQKRRAGDTSKTPDRIPRAALPAEVRQATVLYCELTHTGNEDIDEAMLLLQPPQDRCVEIIRKFSGHLVTTHGGGLLAYFGYPAAREDAPYMAIQAAMAAIRESSDKIEIRVGVHTGQIITSGDLSLPDVVGKTSRLAIQLRQIARPGEVVISEKTQLLISSCFDCEMLPGRTLSSIDRTSKIYRVVRESSTRTRLEAASRLTPMAGRKGEITRLLEHWKLAADGESHAILIKGAPGIGKSRLLHSLKELLKDESHTVRELRCFPEYSHSSFYPVITVLESILDIESDDTIHLRHTKLSRFLQTHHPDKMTVAIPTLAQLLSVPSDQPTSKQHPQANKEHFQQVLFELLQAQSSHQPMLLIVEDIDWIDPSTLELLNRLVLNKLPRILVLFTAKNEYSAPWDASLFQNMTLTPLDENTAMRIIHSLDDTISLPATRQVAKCSEGIPIYIEEITRMVTMDHHAKIPARLQDLFSARFDNMKDAKRIAQLAATIGLRFDIALLRKIASIDTSVLESNLLQLIQAGLIAPSEDSLFQFKHALIQEAAYKSQTTSERKAAHLKIAEVLQSESPNIAANQPELIAQHWTNAGKMQMAVKFWDMAGQVAMKKYAIAEAIEHFKQGLDLITNTISSPEREKTEFELRLKLGAALKAIH